MVKPIMSFTGKHAFLSNFYPCNIVVDGIAYPTIEHAYQAHKTFSNTLRKKIASQPTAGKAKRVGNDLELRRDWEQVKISIMEKLLKKKFKNPALAQKLLDTGNATIIESNHWGDIFWGVSGGTGLNHLGKLLMKIREELRDEGKS